MNINTKLLLDCIPQDSVVQTTLDLDRHYNGITLIHKANTVLRDGTLYFGSASFLSKEDLADDRFGFILQNDLDTAQHIQGVNCLELNSEVNLIELYEEAREVWHQQEIAIMLSDIGELTSSNDLNEIINLSSHILDNPVIFLNSSYQLLAYCCDHSIDDPIVNFVLDHGYMSQQHLVTARKENLTPMILGSEDPIMLDPGGDRTRRRILGIIRYNNNPQGLIQVTEYSRRITKADIQIVKTICRVLSKILDGYNHRGQRASITDIMYASNLTMLLHNEKPRHAWLTGFLSSLQWNQYQHFCVFTIISDDGLYDNAVTAELVTCLRKVTNCFLFLYEHELIMLTNIENNEKRRSCLAQLNDILTRSDLKAGQSKQFGDVMELYEHYQQAKDAIRINQSLGRTAVVSDYSDCMVYDLLQKGQSEVPDALTRFDDARLHTLLTYDKRFGTDYYRTLLVYLQQAFSHTRTSSLLIIHRNTLHYRLEKISELLDTDLSDGEECMKLYLAFKQQEILERP
jgi:hypothetical protein